MAISKRKRPRRTIKAAIGNADVWSEESKARVTAWIEKWRGLLLLNGHHINVEFSDTAKAADDAGDHSGCSAEMWSNFTYMSGHKLVVFPTLLEDPDEEAERKIVHELVHIITFPQRELVRRMFRDYFVTADEAKNTCETATDWIANIVWAIYDKES